MKIPMNKLKILIFNFSMKRSLVIKKSLCKTNHIYVGTKEKCMSREMKFKLKRYIFPYLFQIIKFFIKKIISFLFKIKLLIKGHAPFKIGNPSPLLSSWYLTTLLLDWLPLCASMIAYLHFYFFPNKFFSPLACLHELPKITCHAVLIQQ
jgi:hypothetical protein